MGQQGKARAVPEFPGGDPALALQRIRSPWSLRSGSPASLACLEDRMRSPLESPRKPPALSRWLVTAWLTLSWAFLGWMVLGGGA